MGTDRHPIERLEQTEIREFLDRMWQGIDADAEFMDFARLFEYLAVDSDCMET
jgi:hypothetical protein